ncbi:PAS domain S-box protein [Novosphingobium sp. ST904]|uniref:PAS domain S-box protein n=1 Tax=Novosphingobium sp. ST904 TaxID=1684385 RepID=UPI000ACCD53F|nr:PAS domain S-box protein [Novosphingobium sp. ST904]TCM36053.1 PAS/PAC sensor hybrid histidine kinase [Novosphingobium sp. ST904]
MNEVADQELMRLAALARYDVLDSPREQAFDEMASLAAAICGTPIAVVNFIGDGRQFFKAEVGLGVRETPLETSFCAKALLEEDFLLVPDARRDARFECNPLVTGEPHLRFYAGALLKTGEGLPIGTLCVLDYEPRALDEVQEQALRVLARQTMTALELRRAAIEADGERARHRAIVDSARDFGIVVTDLQGMITDWSAGAESLFGWSEREIVGHPIATVFTDEDREAGVPEREMADAATRGGGSDERWHQRRGGERFWGSGEMSPLRDEAGRHIGYVKVLRDRTEEHLAAQHLATAETRLRQAQEAGGIGLFTVEIAEDVLIPTPEFCRLYGMPVQDRYPASVIETRIVPQDRHLASTAASRSRGEASGEVEYRVRAAEGEDVRWITRKGVMEFDDAGVPLRFVGVARDITAKRQAIAALGRSEDRYRALFEAIDDGFCIIEFIDGPHGPMSDYVHVEANPGYERHSGISGVVGMTLREVDPTGADGWLELYGRVLETGEPVRFERYFAAAGRHIEVSAARVEPPERKQVSVLFRDIEARRRAEQAMRASEALARENIERVQLALSAGAIIGTWLWDLPTDRFTVDEPFARAVGLDPELAREGLSLDQVAATVHPDDRAGFAEAIGDAIARGGGYAHQYRVRRSDGHYYWIEANGRVDHAPDGTPLSFPGVLLDVDQRRAVEEERDRAAAALRALNETLEQRVAERSAELMKAEEQLRQSQKMEAVGQLTGGLAHDFNNLLAGVSGGLEMVGIRLKQGRLADVDKYVVAAQGSVRRAAALTHRLLAFSRRQTLDPRPTSVNALVSGLTDLIQRTVGPSIAVETVGAAGLWLTLVDPSQLENAVLNLCINARDAMPDGGRITIETANKWLDRNGARTHDMPEGQYLSLCVTDTGTGMTPDVIAKAFDPFFTTKPIGQGTGLGLSMIYGFAKQSGGQVRIYSEVGEGTTVCIYLPRHYGDAVEEGGSAVESPLPGAEAGETVLLVDDEPSVRMLITDVLEDLGYTVIEAADSAAGLKVLQSDVRIDLLVSDVGLPGGMNGRQMADAGRVVRPDLKVLFITGYAENSVIGNGYLEPGMRVLTKPFAVETLTARIRELVGG